MVWVLEHQISFSSNLKIVLIFLGFRRIRLYPNGTGSGEGSNISLFLELDTSQGLSPGSTVIADLTIRILDQIHGKHMCRSKGNILPTSVVNSVSLVNQTQK